MINDHIVFYIISMTGMRKWMELTHQHLERNYCEVIVNDGANRRPNESLRMFSRGKRVIATRELGIDEHAELYQIGFSERRNRGLLWLSATTINHFARALHKNKRNPLI